LLVVVNKFSCAGVWKLRQYVEEHSVTVRLLHDFSHLSVQFVNQISCWVIDNFVETLKANATFANVTIEKSNANDNVRKLTKLSDFFRSG